MSLRLSKLLKYKDIVIQCHDNPDADALACGYVLKWYLKGKGIDARFVYGGRFKVGKPNLVLMMEHLGIEAEYVTSLEAPELLVNVDCQYGESNVTRFEAKNVAVIDHHQVSGFLPEMSDVRSAYGSCSTVLYELLQAEDIDINENPDIATALYYGLMTDTSGFAEISHPSDKDLRDFAKPILSEILLFRNSNLTRDELEIAGDALNHAAYNDKHRYGIIEAAPCDPNILGVISDMLLEVSGVDTCLVYSILPFGVKTSVRSCVKEVKAGELAAYLADGFGGGGGHLYKAGGFLKKELLEKAGINYDKTSVEEFITKRLDKYFDESRIIYVANHKEDIGTMDKYTKNRIKVGFARAADFAEPGQVITIRTLEGDVDVTVHEDLYIILGIDGEIYPNSGEKFRRSYQVLEEEYVYPGEYEPTVINVVNGSRIKILPHAKSCMSVDGNEIYARELDCRVKVFTSWDPDKYYLGVPGDYLAARCDDTSDIYVINREIFGKSYTRV